uniref:SDR family NAD(P)-dependent oxidoreductase n=1 Tax=Paraflavitalea pollutisoli TaxID=3034143 RepID=UPI0023EC4D78
QQGSREELVFVEVGAGQSLISLLKQQPVAELPAAFNLVRGIREQADDLYYLTNRIGQLWSSGVPVNWTSWYDGQQRRKVSLPTYSFEPVKYPTEVDPLDGSVLSELGLLAPRTEQALQHWLYYPSWKRVVWKQPLKEPQEPGSCLLMLPAAMDATALKDKILEYNKGQLVIEVVAGTSYVSLGGGRYSIDHTDQRQYEQLVADLAAGGQRIREVVYAAGIQVREGLPALHAAHADLCSTYFGLVWLIQALLRQGMLQDQRIAVLTAGLQSVVGHEGRCYAQSLLLGLVNVLPQEYAVNCFNVDLLAPADINDHAAQLAAAVLGHHGREARVIALRNGHWWSPHYQQHDQPLELPPAAIRQGGVYLVTGGLGNLGFVLGSYLLQQYGAKLVVTGRRRAEDISGAHLERYRALCAISNEVHYCSCDVSDADAFGAAVAGIVQQFGDIHGVIHAAGLIDERYFETVDDISVPKTLAMLQPKVAGIENLYNQFRHRKPDFVWLASSLATVLGGLGFSSYTAANLYMDHLVMAKAAELPAWRSVGLGGMAFSREEIQKESGPVRFALKPAELVTLFHWSLGDRGSQVLIQSIEPLAARIHRIYELERDRSLNDEPVQQDQPGAERPRMSTLFTAPETATEIRLTQLYEQFFGISGIGTNDNFFELGGDSLKGMMLMKRIRRELGVEITLTDFLTNTTLRLLSARIDERTWVATAGVPLENEIVI